MSDKEQLSLKQVKKVPDIPVRKADAHKGDFGRVLVLGGSRDMAGAAGLCARAALRGGAGLVKMAVPAAAQPVAASICPGATSAALACSDNGLFASAAIKNISKVLQDQDVIAAGPGMGVSTACKMILVKLLGTKQPLVLDADALNNLSKIDNWAGLCNCNCILTPHPGEMARLCGLSVKEINADRENVAVKYVRKFCEPFKAGDDGKKMVLVLKGSKTVVTDGENVFTNTTGNPGMATGGSGDCLTGLIAALTAQKLDIFDAATLGVYLHGLAGDIAAEKFGQHSLISEDIIDCFGAAFRKHSKQ